MSKSKKKNQVNGKKLTKQAQREIELEEKNLAKIQIEFPKSNLKKTHAIAERWIEKYDGLVEQGYFADLQKELLEVMSQNSGETVLAIKLGIVMHDYLGSDGVTPLRYSLTLYDKKREMVKCSEESFIATYLVGNELREANSETCPNCRHGWDHKMYNFECRACDAELGQDIKFVIENDECPYCKHPGITASGMVCKKCHKEVYEETVVRLCS